MPATHKASGKASSVFDNTDLDPNMKPIALPSTQGQQRFLSNPLVFGENKKFFPQLKLVLCLNPDMDKKHQPLIEQNWSFVLSHQVTAPPRLKPCLLLVSEHRWRQSEILTNTWPVTHQQNSFSALLMPNSWHNHLDDELLEQVVGKANYPLPLCQGPVKGGEKCRGLQLPWLQHWSKTPWPSALKSNSTAYLTSPNELMAIGSIIHLKRLSPRLTVLTFQKPSLYSRAFIWLTTVAISCLLCLYQWLETAPFPTTWCPFHMPGSTQVWSFFPATLWMLFFLRFTLHFCYWINFWGPTEKFQQ